MLIVIPGAGRNGWDYRDTWVKASEKYGVLILSPRYAENFYPEFWSYNLAGMAREVTLNISIEINTKPKGQTLDDVRKKLESKIDMHELVGKSKASRLIYELVLFSKAGMIKDIDAEAANLVVNTNPKEWIFNDFDWIFEIVKNELGLETKIYDLFGHSAGGQVLHRFAIFYPSSKADQVLAANSGWYTVPTFEQKFPYGLKGTGMTKNHLKTSFSTHLVVFLGQEDNADETRGSLRRTPQVMKQGSGRLERGKYFFQKAQETAEELGTDLEWKIEIVPGVGHDYKGMSKAAAKYLYGGKELN